jgi:hypothetical protein
LNFSETKEDERAIYPTIPRLLAFLLVPMLAYGFLLNVFKVEILVSSFPLHRVIQKEV